MKTEGSNVFQLFGGGQIERSEANTMRVASTSVDARIDDFLRAALRGVAGVGAAYRDELERNLLHLHLVTAELEDVSYDDVQRLEDLARSGLQIELDVHVWAHQGRGAETLLPAPLCVIKASGS